MEMGAVVQLEKPLQLEPYQITGVDWLAGGSRRSLGDDPGLGKSAQAVRAAAKVGAGSIAALCPAKVRTNWQRQFDLWWPDSLDRPRFDVYSYDEAVRGKVKAAYDVLILDEAHYLKNPTSKRTREVYGVRCAGGGLASRCGSVWPLSGTLAPNGNPLEFYPHIRALRPDLISTGRGPMNRQEFLDEFCIYQSTPFGPRIVGVRNGDRLRGILRQLVLRRSVAECAKYLPPIVWSHESVDDDDARQILAGLEATPEVEQLRQHVLASADFHAYEEVAMASLRRVVGTLKAQALGVVFRDQLDSRGGEKIVIFGHHHKTINTLHAELADYGAVQVTGDTRPKDVQPLIDRFNQDPKCRVFIGQTHACGEGIELTAANRVEFVEGDWNPMRMFQALKRVHRRGVASTVFARVWGLAGSVDDLIAGVCARKVQNIKQFE
jgi:SWI/SNF-related matrix-associated actin-dependent regulator 1 of chromatin subfamily A